MATRIPLQDRLWSKIDRRGEDECWPWTGYKKGGYGVLRQSMGTVGGVKKMKDMRAHRLVYEFTHARLMPGIEVRHLCNNPGCCNPKHLAAGTHTDNMRDMRDSDRSTFGEKNPRARLAPAQVEAAKGLREAGWTYKRIGDLFGVHLTTIECAVKGKSWRRRSA